MEVLATGLPRPGLSRGHNNEFIELSFVGLDCNFSGFIEKSSILRKKEELGGGGRRWGRTKSFSRALLRPGLSRRHNNEFIEIQFVGSDCMFQTFSSNHRS